MAYDPGTNRLYIAGQGPFRSGGQISYVNLDGSGGGAFSVANLPNAFIRMPKGIAIDPVTGTLYWINSAMETISWARLNGSEGGEFPLAGEPLVGAIRLAADPAAGRLYWGNSDGTFHFAPLVGYAATAGTLAVHAGGGGTAIDGLAVDPGSGRIFWLEAEDDSVHAGGLTGAGTEAVNVGLAPLAGPIGLAFDPGAGRLYWANSGNGVDPTDAIGFSDLGSGLGGGLTPNLAVAAPQDPVVIKGPTSTSQPPVTSYKGSLACWPGIWAADSPSSSVYQAPRSFGYQWTLNDAPIAGATGQSYTPGSSGSYKCVVTATNQAGSASRASGGVAVTVTASVRPGKTTIRVVPQESQPASLRLLGRARHLKARPGRLLILKVRAANRGDAASKPAKVCLKLTKGARRALRPGKCRRLGPLRGGATDVAKLRLRVKHSARPGLYRLRISLPGTQTKVTVRVLG